ncbi:hypothetical protein HALLA_09355 [Halostagnicola larsenii XH-48]|uniref:Uncharacterized protein n=1 Tax=Halostagnicola larsenii XH-48 TaxID=797299 RepID=W0JKC2_9EURY|nr:hypothetical protein [Halostagnicola larsenii]AHF99048.1 hypothetical protein HALLA_09355 [Halostagnicola larsenii XH-48]
MRGVRRYPPQSKARRAAHTDPSRDTGRRRTDRGQAYTLEGVVGAAIVLAAVLVVYQTGGFTAAIAESERRDEQYRLQQQTHDALVVAATAPASTGNLSAFVRAWNGSRFSSGELEAFVLGEVLAEQFGESPRNREYRISFSYEDENATIARETVYATTDENPGSNAVAASYTETVVEDANEPDPHPSLEAESGPIAAVVDVEVTVW